MGHSALQGFLWTSSISVSPFPSFFEGFVFLSFFFLVFFLYFNLSFTFKFWDFVSSVLVGDVDFS